MTFVQRKARTFKTEARPELLLSPNCQNKIQGDKKKILTIILWWIDGELQSDGVPMTMRGLAARAAH